jgi:protein TonB
MKKLLLITTLIILFSSLGIAKPHQPVPIAKTQQDLTPPEFPGGEKAFHRYLNSHIKWPKSNKTHGIVVISFIVEKTGYLSDFKIVKSVEKHFDAEVLRVITKSPRWIPAMRNGKSIKSGYSAPVQLFAAEIQVPLLTKNRN